MTEVCCESTVPLVFCVTELEVCFEPSEPDFFCELAELWELWWTEELEDCDKPMGAEWSCWDGCWEQPTLPIHSLAVTLPPSLPLAELLDRPMSLRWLGAFLEPLAEACTRPENPNVLDDAEEDPLRWITGRKPYLSATYSTVKVSPFGAVHLLGT